MQTSNGHNVTRQLGKPPTMLGLFASLKSRIKKSWSIWRNNVWDGLGHKGTSRTEQGFDNWHKASILHVRRQFGTTRSALRNRCSYPELRWHRNQISAPTQGHVYFLAFSTVFNLPHIVPSPLVRLSVKEQPRPVNPHPMPDP